MARSRAIHRSIRCWREFEDRCEEETFICHDRTKTWSECACPHEPLVLDCIENTARAFIALAARSAHHCSKDSSRRCFDLCLLCDPWSWREPLGQNRCIGPPLPELRWREWNDAFQYKISRWQWAHRTNTMCEATSVPFRGRSEIRGQIFLCRPTPPSLTSDARGASIRDTHSVRRTTGGPKPSNDEGPNAPT